MTCSSRYPGTRPAGGGPRLGDGLADGEHDAADQGLTLVHISAQRKHISWDTLGAWFSISILDRGTRGGVPRTA